MPALQAGVDEHDSEASGLSLLQDLFVERAPTPPWAEDFWAKVAIALPLDCWLWLGTRQSVGYGSFQKRPAHQLSVELVTGTPWPEGLVGDHLCRVPPCVNPWHIEPVTPGENVRRGNMARKLGALPEWSWDKPRKEDM